MLSRNLARKVSCPNEDDFGRLEKVVKYLKGAPRFRTICNYQKRPEAMEVWTDSEESASGGVIQHGEHIIKSWSNNQAVIALSSGEAEYYALVKGVSGAIGATNLCQDLGTIVEGPIKAKTDANAAIGIASRLGVGKVRHIEVNQLWLQQKVYEKSVEIIKVPPEENLADVLTKVVDSIKLRKHIGDISAWINKDRHELTPGLDYGKQTEEDIEEEE
jgi:hypothetical protein